MRVSRQFPDCRSEHPEFVGQSRDSVGDQRHVKPAVVSHIAARMPHFPFPAVFAIQRGKRVGWQGTGSCVQGSTPLACWFPARSASSVSIAPICAWIGTCAGESGVIRPRFACSSRLVRSSSAVVSCLTE